MKITDIDFINGSTYEDQYENIWLVQNGELVDESLIDIHYSYTMEEIANLNLKVF